MFLKSEDPANVCEPHSLLRCEEGSSTDFKAKNEKAKKSLFLTFHIGSQK